MVVPSGELSRVVITESSGVLDIGPFMLGHFTEGFRAAIRDEDQAQDGPVPRLRLAALGRGDPSADRIPEDDRGIVLTIVEGESVPEPARTSGGETGDAVDADRRQTELDVRARETVEPLDVEGGIICHHGTAEFLPSKQRLEDGQILDAVEAWLGNTERRLVDPETMRFEAALKRPNFRSVGRRIGELDHWDLRWEGA